MGERNLLIKLLGDASNLNKAFKDAGGGADGMSGVFDKMKGKLAAALSVGAAVKFGTDCVKAFENVAASTGKLQRLTGGTAEDMSRLAFEAKESGVSQELLEKSLTKMSKAMVNGSGAFETLGIKAKNADGTMRPMGDVMLELSDKFKGMENGAEKNALAMQIFGKTGTDMLPMLNRGGEALAEFGKESDKFGLTIGQGSVDAYKKHVAESRKMHAAMEGLKVQIGEKLFPIFAKFAAFMAENLPKAIEFVKGVFESLKPVFEQIGLWVANLVIWWKAHWDEIRDKVVEVFGYISGFVSTIVDGINAFWRTFGENVIGVLQGMWEQISAIFEGAFKVIQGIFLFFRDLFTGQWGKLWGDVLAVVDGIWTAIRGIIQGFIDEIIAILGGAWTIISSALSSAWDGMKSLVKGAIDGMIAFVEAIPGRVVSGLSSLASLLAGIGLAAVTALWDAFSGAIVDGWHWVSDLPGKFATILSTIGDKIKDGFAKIPRAIWDAFKAAWNAVADLATFTLPQVTIPMPPGVPDIHFGGNTLTLLPHLHTGGEIPGLTGQEVLVVARAGERMQTQGQARADKGAHGGDTFVFHGVTDPRQISSMISREQGWKLRAA